MNKAKWILWCIKNADRVSYNVNGFALIIACEFDRAPDKSQEPDTLEYGGCTEKNEFTIKLTGIKETLP